MQGIKIISMDFDGTLLTRDKKISNKTKACLEELKNNYKIVGITARNIQSVKATLNVRLFDYIILNNGCDIYYVKTDEIKNIKKIENKTIENLFNLFKSDANEIDFCTPFNYLIIKKQKDNYKPFIKYINDFKEINESISRLNIFFETNEELLNNKKIIENNYNDVDVIKMIDTDNLNSKKWLTINPKNVNKLTTLKYLCNELNCSIDKVIFFGDGENDLELIENAGIGVAMNNAVDSVKEKAKYITSSNDDDGVAVFLEKNFY